jgi:hypothetical protein
MTTDEIRQRIVSLQDEINSLAAMLPEHAQIAFGTVYLTKPTDLVHRKRLVVAIRERAQTTEKTQQGAQQSA